MLKAPDSAGVYTDFSGLAKLKVEAQKQTPEAVRETARQFEALFVQLVLKAVREADDSLGHSLFDSSQSQFYQEMWDKQMALHLSQGRGVGLADSLTRQLSGQPEVQRTAGTGLTRQPFSAAAPPPAGSAERSEGAASAEKTAAAEEPDRFDSPEQFVATVLPHLKAAAAELGVDPAVLVAQAALETGWGRSVIRNSDGSSSHNLFNIKADSRWQGARAQVNTVEFEQGTAVRRPAAFRAYDSYAESARDYADFLRRNPRYAPALEQSSDPAAFLQGLHKAGYATDPAYVEKIRSLLEGPALRSALDENPLKSSG